MAADVGEEVGAFDVVAVTEAEAPCDSDAVMADVPDGVDAGVTDGVGEPEQRSGKLCTRAAVRDTCASVALLTSRTVSVLLMARVSQERAMPAAVQAAGGVQQVGVCAEERGEQGSGGGLAGIACCMRSPLHPPQQH